MASSIETSKPGAGLAILKFQQVFKVNVNDYTVPSGEHILYDQGVYFVTTKADPVSPAIIRYPNFVP